MTHETTRWRPTARAVPALATSLILLACGVARAQPADIANLASAHVTSDVRFPDLATATDVVFVADGYLADEEPLFLKAAREAVKRIDDDPASRPVQDLKHFNFHFVFVASNEHALATAGAAPRDTACRGSLRADRTLQTDDARAEAIAARAPDVDGVVVLIHFVPSDWQIRANADIRPGQQGRLRMPDDDVGSLLHEMGHAFFGVGDEYEEFEGEPPPSRKADMAWYPNLSADRTGARWASIVPSVFEGGGGWSKGVFRAEEHCRMRECRTEAFCKVCLAQITKRSRPKAPTILTPAASAKLADAVVAVTWKPVDDSPVSAWWVTTNQMINGQWQLTGSVPVEGHLLASTLELAPGRWSVGLHAMSAGGNSETVWRSFEVKAGAGSPVAAPPSRAAPRDPPEPPPHVERVVCGVTAAADQPQWGLRPPRPSAAPRGARVKPEGAPSDKLAPGAAVPAERVPDVASLGLARELERRAGP